MTFGYPTVDLITPDLSGLYRIDHEAYHAGLGISSTKIKQALISWGHYNAEHTADSPAMAFGRAFHMAVLEPDEFRKRYVVAPDMSIYGHPNSNVYRDAKADFAAKNADKEVIKPDKMLQIEGMHAALRKHPQWNKIAGYSPEIMGIRTNEATGLKFKCKMDLFGGAIVDLKTTDCASLGEFRRSVLNYGYHISAAFYHDLITAITGESLPFVHVAIEKEPPYGVAFYCMDDDYIHEGRKLYDAAAHRIATWNTMTTCQRELSYGSGIKTLTPTASVAYKTLEILEGMK